MHLPAFLSIVPVGIRTRCARDKRCNTIICSVGDSASFFLPSESREGGRPPRASDNSLSIAASRLRQKTAELKKLNNTPQPDDDDKWRAELANERISSADLFRHVDSSDTSAPDRENPFDSLDAMDVKVSVSPGSPTVSTPMPVGDVADQSAANAMVVKTEKKTKKQPSKRERPPVLSDAIVFDSDLEQPLVTGAIVQHQRHGIGRFSGLERTRRSICDAPTVIQEFIVIEYRDGDIYVPLSHLDLIRVLSPEEAKAVSRLDLIAGAGALSQKPTYRARRSNYVARTKARKKIRQQLVNLHGLYAQRTSAEREPFHVDVEAERSFWSACEFELTNDQKEATRQILSDMSDSRRPMDRLLCGDVGFGKTEVAIRAAFRALKAGKQVAVLAPTTILAQQHFETFSVRLRAFWPDLQIACLNRFIRKRQLLQWRDGVNAGTIQLAVGTHMLLSASLVFDNLGLLIVDEEHRFGVNQKERIRERYRGVDTLFLSATPIPRTLHLSLSGLRDASVLRTPPVGRKSVITKIHKSGSGVVRQAIGQELDRGGQVFFVVPRIEGIEGVSEWIQEMFVDSRILVAHGSTPDLEGRIWRFSQHEYDILVCTTIIENGLNLPDVNTIIIQDASRFGLAQLHQLRGRVGRSDVQAYAWLLYTSQGEQNLNALQRLRALERNSSLGSGFVIAQHDMEMRGVGEILGVEQHGSGGVGAEDYARMLAEELEHVRTGKPIPITLPKTSKVDIFLPIAGLIPEEYIPNFTDKMTAYTAMSKAESVAGLHRVVQSIENHFGPVPPNARRHISMLEVKLYARSIGISKIAAERQHVVMDWEVEEQAFNLLVAFLADEQSRRRCEHVPAEDRVVLRGLGVCSGDVQLATVRSFLECFHAAAQGLDHNSNDSFPLADAMSERT